jgi:hypothetical protein
MSTLVAQTISNGTVSTSSENVIQGSAKAWVNFDGSTGTTNASYNVSSVTRNGTGDYTVNFTNSFADINYCYQLSGRYWANGQTANLGYGLTFSSSASQAPTTTTLRVWASIALSTSVATGVISISNDPQQINVSVLR